MSDDSGDGDDDGLPFGNDAAGQKRVPFSKLVELRARGQLRPTHKREGEGEDRPSKKKRKKSKSGEPAVLSTKVPLSRKRVVLPEAVRKARDPRFDGVTGAVDVGMLGQAYGFVDEARASELKELEESLKSTIDPEDRESIVERIHLLRDQERVLGQQKQAHELSVRVKAHERKLAVEAGRRVKLSSKKKREIEMAERFKMLEEKGDVDRFLKDKRKKLQQRNKRLIPVSKK